MKQLYIIGIIVAILLLVLLGLSKLGGQSEDSATEQVADQEAQALEALQNNQENDMDAAPDTVVDGNTTLIMKTNKGDITIELYTKDMPITAGNFLKLAQDDFYDGIKFHRIIDGFMIQGGDPLTKDDSMQARWGTGGPGYAIEDEFGPRHSNAVGTLSMANSGPNTGGSQFFINTAANTFLDGKHPVFGKIIGGMDIVTAISTTATGPGDVPVEPVVIEDMEVKA